MTSKMIFVTFAILVSTLSVVESQDQDWYNDKMDLILSNYQNLTQDEMSNVSFLPNYTFAFTGSGLSSTQNLTNIMIDGLSMLFRNGDVKGSRTGQNSWKISGKLNLSAPLISGNLDLNLEDKSTASVQVICTTDADIVYDFDIIVNYHWNRIIVQSLTYENPRYLPTFAVQLDCPLNLDNVCSAVQSTVTTYITNNAASKTISLTKRILSNVPLTASKIVQQ